MHFSALNFITFLYTLLLKRDVSKNPVNEGDFLKFRRFVPPGPPNPKSSKIRILNSKLAEMEEQNLLK